MPLSDMVRAAKSSAGDFSGKCAAWMGEEKVQTAEQLSWIVFLLLFIGPFSSFFVVALYNFLFFLRDGARVLKCT